MIVTVNEVLEFIDTDKNERALTSEILSLESLIRKYTNNNFNNRNIRYESNILNNELILDSKYLKVGDTIQIALSKFNDGIYTIESINDGRITLNENLYDEDKILVTKVDYPHDVKMGVIKMLKWQLEKSDKVGIQSETISRHSVSYFNMDNGNSELGFPTSLLGFLKPYKKVRF
jgi:hypothetical protein